MSTNNAKLLLEQAARDKEFFASLAETETVRLSQFAARAGYPCTLREIKASLDELTAEQGLSAEQLHTASGGKIEQSDAPANMLALLTALNASLSSS